MLREPRICFRSLLCESSWVSRRGKPYAIAGWDSTLSFVKTTGINRLEMNGPSDARYRVPNGIRCQNSWPLHYRW